MTCSECRFFDEANFECHRNPPQFAYKRLGDVSFIWPMVDGYNWCGEFQPRIEDTYISITENGVEGKLVPFDASGTVPPPTGHCERFAWCCLTAGHNGTCQDEVGGVYWRDNGFVGASSHQCTLQERCYKPDGHKPPCERWGGKPFDLPTGK